MPEPTNIKIDFSNAIEVANVIRALHAHANRILACDVGDGGFNTSNPRFMEAVGLIRIAQQIDWQATEISAEYQKKHYSPS